MTRQKAIHVLHIASGDIWAGAEAQLYTLAKTLHQSEMVKVSVVLMNYGILEKKLKSEGIDVIVFDETKLNGLKIISRIFTLLRRVKPDIVHTHGKKENILSSFCLVFFNNIVSMRTSHGAPEHSPSLLLFHKWLYNFADWFSGRILQRKIIAVSTDLKVKLAEHFPETRIAIIQNGLDILNTTHHLPSKEFHQPAEAYTFRIGFAGRLVPVKRVDLFIQVAKKFISTYPDISATFHIYGTGPLKNELEKLNLDSGVSESIIFEGQTDNMATELNKTDILIMISDHEGLPMVLLEAMACQAPIVAHAVGGIPELLDHGQCGVLINNQNPIEYADAIRTLLSSTNRRQILSRNAYDRLSQHYSSQTNADAYIEIYSSLIN
ncbi:MAG: glycosyltransferase [Methylococcaceae bacterium]